MRYFLESAAAGGVSRADVAASLQAAVVDVLIDRVERALDACANRAIVLSGGVAASQTLATAFRRAGDARGVATFVPERRFCTDNAAMIAAAAERRGVAGLRGPLTLTADPTCRSGAGRARSGRWAEPPSLQRVFQRQVEDGGEQRRVERRAVGRAGHLRRHIGRDSGVRHEHLRTLRRIGVPHRDALTTAETNLAATSGCALKKVSLANQPSNMKLGPTPMKRGR